MAGIDGIENQIDPGEPVDDVDLFDVDPVAMGYPTIPGSLDETLSALEDDHAFLLKGDVFSSDLIETWVDYKREAEIEAVRIRPHPMEFQLYYDA